MINIEHIMTIINAERKHAKINILEEIKIVKAGKLANTLNDVIIGKNGPL